MRESELFEATAPGANRLRSPDFSLVLGGPLYRLYLRTRLARPALDLMRRRIVCLAAIGWVPPLLLAWFAGRLAGGVEVPFLADLDVHIKFLAVLPLLIASELVVHRRISALVPPFSDRGIVAPQDRWRFERLVESAMLLRNSPIAEALLFAAVFTLGHIVWRRDLSLHISSWYADGKHELSAAGDWYAFVSLPLFRFLVFRWYFRLFIWYRFLWGVRKLPLRLNLFHPDRVGGLGFLDDSVFAFAPVLVAQSLALTGMIGNRIWHTGAALAGFKVEIAAALLFLMATVLAPLTFFTIDLLKRRPIASREFGLVASRYVDDFRGKWVLDGGDARQELLGTPDIQSLADLGNAYEMVNDMRIMPCTPKTVLRVMGLVAAPMVPLVLTIVPLDRMIDGLVKLVL